MRSIRLLLMLASCLAVQGCGDRAAPAGSGEEEAGTQVVHLRIEGVLDVGALSMLQRSVRAQPANTRSWIVVEIDTPGGEIDLMWKLARQIGEASKPGVQTVAWINRQALSAGALLALACDRIYMRSSSVIGAALPVQLSPSGIDPVSPDPDIKEKHMSALRADFRAWAESNGRSPVLAEAMVDPNVEVYWVRHGTERRLMSGKEWDDAVMRGDDVARLETIVGPSQLLSLSGEEAVRFGLADGMAEDFGEVLEKIGASGAAVTTEQRTRSEDLASFLYSIRLLLLVVALVAAYFELKMPGFGVPGMVSIAAFGLLMFGHYLVGLADIPHIVAVALGLILLAVEIFLLPGTIWLGLIGGLLVIGGLVLAGIGPGVDLKFPLDRRLALDSAFNTLLGLGAALMLAIGLSRFLPKTPFLRQLALVNPSRAAALLASNAALHQVRAGARGIALTDLRPVGKVALDGDPEGEHEASSTGLAIDSGTPIEVVEVRSTRLVVEARAGKGRNGSGVQPTT